jgi:nucleotidyltransferase substrate binding protein (TIGR01987 family)
MPASTRDLDEGVDHMSDPDIRWKQRFHNFKKALAQLNEAEALSRQRALSRLENQGLIQAFEFTFELAWNTLKDFLTSKGTQDLFGSKDTARAAFKQQLITDEHGWTMMLNDRNRSSHTYNEATADEIVEHIHSHFVDLFGQLSAKLAAHVADE